MTATRGAPTATVKPPRCDRRSAQFRAQKKYETDLGFRPRSRRITKYATAHDGAEKLRRWQKAAMMHTRDPAFCEQYRKVHARAVRDMRAKRRAAPIRLHHRPGRI